MNNYQILDLPINATQREIYNSFLDKIDYRIPFSEQSLIIDAFIILSDINLRKKYDLSIGLDFSSDSPQYLYSYFGNGEGLFSYDGNLAGSKELTRFIVNRKKDEIRCSDSVEDYYNEAIIYQSIAKTELKNVPLKASLYDKENSNELEKFEIFKKIYESYKKDFLFSNSFVSFISDRSLNSLTIDEMTKLACQEVLNYKRGVCTHFAALLYQELNRLGIEVYYVRLILQRWVHHVVLYRVENEWYIGDLTNEYLKGEAGYNIDTNNYSSITLLEFLSKNMQLLDMAYLPNYFGELLTDSEVVTLRKFIETRNENKKL